MKTLEKSLLTLDQDKETLKKHESYKTIVNQYNSDFKDYRYYIDTLNSQKTRKVELQKKHDSIIIGGNYDKSKGYFVSPTIILTTNPNFITMEKEIFGPVVTIYIYEDNNWKDTLSLVDKTSMYALTGAFISNDRDTIDHALKTLRYSAGNFYINDKPSGAVVGQQPFGGSRASGTNDKAGSKLNLLRWVSPRLIKENFNPPTDYPYPYMA
mgnify:CR=1 FL=1